MHDSSLHDENNPEKHKEQFPSKYDSTKVVALSYFKEEFSFNKGFACAMLTSKGHKSYQNNELTMDSLQKLR